MTQQATKKLLVKTLVARMRAELNSGNPGAVLTSLLTTVLTTGTSKAMLVGAFEKDAKSATAQQRAPTAPLRVLTKAQVGNIEPTLLPLTLALLGLSADGDMTQLVDVLELQWKGECDSGKHGAVLTSLLTALLADVFGFGRVLGFRDVRDHIYGCPDSWT
jgi:hypothetical protein